MSWVKDLDEVVSSDRIVAVTVPLALAGVIFCLSRCEQAVDVERERTQQEAIKAGLVQGEYSRWVRPTMIPAEKR